MMSSKPPLDVQALQRRFRRGVRLASLGLALAGGAALRLAWIGVRRFLGIGLALLLLFEQWGWQPLSAGLAALGKLAPVGAVERLIRALPPYGALVIFALPTALLVPLKLLALYLIASGHPLSAGILFVGAKIVGTALVARLYQLTEPQLMQIAWVRRAHEVLLPRLHALHEAIRRSWAWRYGRVLKMQAKRTLAPMTARLKLRLAEMFSIGRGPV